MSPKIAKERIKKPFYKKPWFIVLAIILLLSAFTPKDEPKASELANGAQLTTPAEISTEAILTDATTEISNQTTQPTTMVSAEIASSQNTAKAAAAIVASTDTLYELNGKSYKIIKVDGGDISGTRQPNVAVKIGFGDRDYWGFTNENAQLVYVKATEITLQDPTSEAVLSSGRYYDDEAKVKGTEREDLDEGHVIADSLGGVANAYNITPQDSTLNRHGDQAYMEKVIRDAEGCSNFLATITYPSSDTQIPSHYRFEYVIQGNQIVDEFDNVNPDVVNANIVNTPPVTTTPPATESSFDENAELKKVDTNGNGKVTIAEAKAAGFKMPVKRDNWLYKYMTDSDGDGQVGE